MTQKVCGTLESLSAITMVASALCFMGGGFLLLSWFSNPDSAPVNAIPLAIYAFGSGFGGWMLALIGQALVYIARKQ